MLGHLSFTNLHLLTFFLFCQLKSLLQKSVEEFANLFDPSNCPRLPLFRMALTFDDEKMEIYPTLQDLEAAVFEILNAITNTLQVRLCVCAAHLKENKHFMADFY